MGYLDELTTDQLNLIKKILTSKVNNQSNPLFELPYTDDATVTHFVDKFYGRMVAEKRIDVLVEKKPSKSCKDIQAIDINSIRNKDVREIGAEWMSYQSIAQLQIASFLERQGWSHDDIKLAQSHIISRAVYPVSELETPYAKLKPHSVNMKTYLDLRPIYHQKDESTMAHLHLDCWHTGWQIQSGTS